MLNTVQVEMKFVFSCVQVEVQLLSHLYMLLSIHIGHLLPLIMSIMKY
jgi:hypothetical protein